MFILISKKKLKYIVFFTFILLFSIYIFPLSSSLLANQEENSNVLTDAIIYRFRNIYRETKKVAYLTFDDGPSKTVTPKILDILKENNIKATFFVIGKQVEQNPEILKRIYDEGHFIANHTFSHNNQSIYKSKKIFLEEIQKTDSAIAKAIGVSNYKSHVFRFPNGSTQKAYEKEKQTCIKYLSEIDYTYIDWNALNDDSMKKYSSSQLLQNLKNSCKGKNTLVVLMHDTGDVNPTDKVLQDSIDFLKENGYSFSSLNKLFEY